LLDRQEVTSSNLVQITKTGTHWIPVFLFLIKEADRFVVGVLLGCDGT
jgi:hypothetical protein